MLFRRLGFQSLRRYAPLGKRNMSYSVSPPVDPGWVPHVAGPVFSGVLAAVLSANNENDEFENQVLFTVRDFSQQGKGLGCVASRNIKKGELIIHERPLCVWPQGLTEAQAKEYFDAMSPQQQEAYMQLSPGHLDASGSESEDACDGSSLGPILARRATNGFQLSIEGNSNAAAVPGAPDYAAFVFPTIARINHSCLPNAAQTINFGSLRMEVFAVSDIAEGEEICIEYMPSLILMTHEERWVALEKAFGFDTCKCLLCQSPLVHESDARRSALANAAHDLQESQSVPDVVSRRRMQLNIMAQILHIVREEGYRGPVDLGDSSLSNAYAIYESFNR